MDRASVLRSALGGLASVLASGCLVAFDFEGYVIPPPFPNDPSSTDGGRGGEGEAFALVPLQTVRVHRGGSVDVMVTIRRRTSAGPIAIAISDLPAGVTSSQAEIAENATSATITIAASEQVRLETVKLSLRASPLAGGPTSTSTLTLVVGGSEFDSSFGVDGIARGRRLATTGDMAFDRTGRCHVAVFYSESPEGEDTSETLSIERADDLGVFTPVVTEVGKFASVRMAIAHDDTILVSNASGASLTAYGKPTASRWGKVLEGEVVQRILALEGTFFVLTENYVDLRIRLLGINLRGEPVEQFGAGGSTDIDAISGVGRAEAVLTEKGIVVCWSRYFESDASEAVVFRRYRYDGSIDTLFGDGGETVLARPKAALTCTGLASAGPTGVVASILPNSEPTTAMLYALDDDGRPRRDFGVDGVLSVADEVASLALAIDPRLGRVYTAVSDHEARVVGHRSDGTVDGAFGGPTGGQIALTIAKASMERIAIAEDGRILIFGSDVTATPTWFVARIQP